MSLEFSESKNKDYIQKIQSEIDLLEKQFLSFDKGILFPVAI